MFVSSIICIFVPITICGNIQGNCMPIGFKVFSIVTSNLMSWIKGMGTSCNMTHNVTCTENSMKCNYQ